jgi:capsule polysaccharide export protein KpsE/RkpR
MFEPIKELFNILNSMRSFLSRIFIGLTLVSLIYIFLFRVPSYTSNAKIFINSKDSSMQVSQSFLGGILGNKSDGARDVQILSEIIIGNSFFGQLLENKTIIFSNDKNDHTFESWMRGEINSNNIEKMHSHFLKILSMSYDSKRQLITIGVKADERETARNLSSLLLFQIEKSYFSYKNSLEENKINSILIRVKEVEKSLSSIQDKITLFRRNNIDFEKSPKLLIEYENFLRERLILEQTIGTLYTQKEMSEIEMKLNRDLFLIINEPYLPSYKDKPTNRNLFFMLEIIAFIISISFTLIKYELSKNRREL